VSGCALIKGHRVFSVLRSYSLEHELGEELLPLLLAHRDVVNQILEELWSHIEWKKRKLPGKKQWRLLPKYKVDIHSKEYKKKLRDSLLEGWPYAAHWVDSAIKTAYSIFKTWRKNYVKGERKRRRPTAKRLFARAKQTLIKLEGEKLRVTVKPDEYVHIDLSKRYFPLPKEVSSAGLGEPIITPEKVHLPVHYWDDAQRRKTRRCVGLQPPLPGRLLTRDRVDKDRHFEACIYSHRLLRKEEERSEEGFTLEKSKKSSFKVLEQGEEPREKTPARNHACNPVCCRCSGPRRALQAGDVHTLAYLES